MKKVLMGGICGMGMSPLAMFLRDSGEEVYGFDDVSNVRVERELEAKGVKLLGREVGEEFFDEFIITSALKSRMGEFRGVRAGKVCRRGEALAEICSSRRLVAVCGSHGKTTVTALLAEAVNREGLDCGYMVGGYPNKFSPTKYCSEGKIIISEVDESDGTIEKFFPEVTVALNSDLDHVDMYRDDGEIVGMFERIFSRTKSFIVIPRGDDKLLEAAKGSGKRYVEVEVSGKDFLSYDKAMAVSVLNELFFKEYSEEIFSKFGGVGRRQEVLKEEGGVKFIADYAHHPRELEEFLKWLEVEESGKKLIIFQPHRYSRTKRFGGEFRKVLRLFGGMKKYVIPVYGASEVFDIEGTSKEIACEDIELIEKVGMDGVVKEFLSKNGEGCVAFVGAGDIYFEAKKIL